MEEPVDDDKGKEKEKEDQHPDDEEPNFTRDPKMRRQLLDSGTKIREGLLTSMITVLGGIKCNEHNFGLSACYAPERYGNAVDDITDLFRKNYPKSGLLRLIFKCGKLTIRNKMGHSPPPYFFWKEMRCPDKMFCGIERNALVRGLPTSAEDVNILCMGEEVPDEGNKNWYNTNQYVSNDVLEELGKRVDYMNQHIVTDHPSVKKSLIQKLGLVIADAVYPTLIEKLKLKEKPHRDIEPQTSFRKAATQKAEKLKKKIVGKPRRKTKSEDSSGGSK